MYYIDNNRPRCYIEVGFGRPAMQDYQGTNQKQQYNVTLDFFVKLFKKQLMKQLSLSESAKKID